MSARDWGSRLICSALLGVLVASCGAPSGSTVSAPGLDEPARPTATVAADGRPPAGEGTGTGGSGSSDEIDERAGRPDGAPPGVGFELPTRGADLRQEQQWKESVDGSCVEAGLEPGCLPLDVRVVDENEGGRTPIPNPGPNYDDRDGEYECLVEDMNPRSRNDGGPEEVPAGTVVVVTVVCASTDVTEPSAEPSPSPDGSTDPAGQQPDGDGSSDTGTGTSDGSTG